MKPTLLEQGDKHEDAEMRLQRSWLIRSNEHGEWNN